MFCSKCGCEIKNNDEFCSKCGSKLKNDVSENNHKSKKFRDQPVWLQVISIIFGIIALIGLLHVLHSSMLAIYYYNNL